MSIEQTLQDRSGGQCELCSSADNLSVFAVGPEADNDADRHILVCGQCREQIEEQQPLQDNHWRCLNDSMWSAVPAVQVMAWRMLKRLGAEPWAQDLLDILYLDDDTLSWAKAGQPQGDSDQPATLDSNGTPLAAGDSVTLIKDLVVKGAGFTAKRGTLVKNISLTDNPEHIEGRVNGTRIVLVSAYLKKAN